MENLSNMSLSRVDTNAVKGVDGEELSATLIDDVSCCLPINQEHAADPALQDVGTKMVYGMVKNDFATGMKDH